MSSILPATSTKTAPTYVQLWSLVAACVPITAAQVAATPVATLNPHQAILKTLDILVFGEVEGTTTIATFSPRLGKYTEIRQIDKLQIENLVQSYGDEVLEHVHDSREPIAGKLTIKDVRRAIASEAGRKPVKIRNHLGAGCWESAGRILLVGAGELLICNGHLEKSKTPVVDDRLIEFGSSDAWYEYAELEKFLTGSEQPQWCVDVLNEAISLFARWDNWKYSRDPELVAALVCCSWLQTVWDWRPLVAVTGPTNCGKTIFLDTCLGGLFGKLGFFASKPSEAGIRQELRNTAKITRIDELEHDEGQRKKIFELLRTSSRGGQVYRGTSNHRGTSFGMRHIVWIGAIETGLSKSADVNRFIVLDLTAVRKKPGSQRLQIPPASSLNTLGQKMLVVALRVWRQVKVRCTELLALDFKAFDPRMIESYSLPVAFLSVVRGLSLTEAGKLLETILCDRSDRVEVETDNETLLAEIFGSIVVGDRGSRNSVSQLLDPSNLDPQADFFLEQHGIKRVQARNGEPEQLHFVQGVIKRMLLKDSLTKHLNLNDLLLRIPGAKKKIQRMGSSMARGISIPMEFIEAIMNGKLDQDYESTHETQDSGSNDDVF